MESRKAEPNRQHAHRQYCENDHQNATRRSRKAKHCARRSPMNAVRNSLGLLGPLGGNKVLRSHYPQNFPVKWGRLPDGFRPRNIRPRRFLARPVRTPLPGAKLAPRGDI
jgi:hypothetical protein